jgi:hypothetical protein
VGTISSSFLRDAQIIVFVGKEGQVGRPRTTGTRNVSREGGNGLGYSTTKTERPTKPEACGDRNQAIIVVVTPALAVVQRDRRREVLGFGQLSQRSAPAALLLLSADFFPSLDDQEVKLVIYPSGHSDSDMDYNYKAREVPGYYKYQMG